MAEASHLHAMVSGVRPDAHCRRRRMANQCRPLGNRRRLKGLLGAGGEGEATRLVISEAWADQSVSELRVCPDDDWVAAIA
jgi:hypothetical protein